MQLFLYYFSEWMNNSEIFAIYFHLLKISKPIAEKCDQVKLNLNS